VIEIVTGFVRSNILHHGLHAPEDSPYIRIKPHIERIKYEGNRNGMLAEEYAASVVDKLVRKGTGAEIREGKLSWTLGFLINFFPLWFLVCKTQATSSSWRRGLVPRMTDMLPEVSDVPCRIGSFLGSSDSTSWGPKQVDHHPKSLIGSRDLLRCTRQKLLPMRPEQTHPGVSRMFQQ